MLMPQLYLLGRSRLSAINRGETIMRGSRKTLKLFVCFLPVLIATWVAITRSIDNWHHYSDILGGSIIGAVSACVAYDYNYGSVFSWDGAGITREELSERQRVRSVVCSLCLAPYLTSHSGSWGAGEAAGSPSYRRIFPNPREWREIAGRISTMGSRSPRVIARIDST